MQRVGYYPRTFTFMASKRAGLTLFKQTHSLISIDTHFEKKKVHQGYCRWLTVQGFSTLKLF